MPRDGLMDALAGEHHRRVAVAAAVVADHQQPGRPLAALPHAHQRAHAQVVQRVLVIDVDVHVAQAAERLAGALHEAFGIDDVARLVDQVAGEGDPLGHRRPLGRVKLLCRVGIGQPQHQLPLGLCRRGQEILVEGVLAQCRPKGDVRARCRDVGLKARPQHMDVHGTVLDRTGRRATEILQHPPVHRPVADAHQHDVVVAAQGVQRQRRAGGTGEDRCCHGPLQRTAGGPVHRIGRAVHHGTLADRQDHHAVFGHAVGLEGDLSGIRCGCGQECGRDEGGQDGKTLH